MAGCEQRLPFFSGGRGRGGKGGEMAEGASQSPENIDLQFHGQTTAKAGVIEGLLQPKHNACTAKLGEYESVKNESDGK